MSQRWLLSLLAVTAATPALAGSNYRYVHRPEADVYFGHISYCELKNDGADPHVVRAEGAEAATLNLPLAPGDALITTAGRRCEAQFDTGTLLRLDESSSVVIETILAASLTTNDKLTNLHLQAGRLNVMFRDYDSRELFQVLTPNAAVKLSNAAVVNLQLAESGETVVEVERGQASVLYGPSLDKTTTRKLKAGERITIGTDDRLVQVSSSRERAKDAFDDWNRRLNDRFVELHSGKSELPKPIQRFPRAVLYFAQQYGDPYGEWVWSELYGYVWRPRVSQDEGWRPYQSGRWVPISGRLFWVPQEPWGWVPYHLGLWHFDKKHGWVWLPGSNFAPAWVSWTTCDDARYFRPLSIWDWSLRRSRSRVSQYRYAYASGPCGLYPDWFRQDEPVRIDVAGLLTPPAAPTPNPSDEGGPNPIRRLPERPLLPLPGELDKIARKAEPLVERADPAVREALDVINRSAEALRIEKPAPLPAAIEVHELRPALERFRDWNGDVRAARNAGGHIVYSSVTNMVRCESCSRPLINFDFASRSLDAGRNSGSSDSGSNSSSSGSSGGGGPASSGVGTGAGPSGEQGRSGGERIRD